MLYRNITISGKIAVGSTTLYKHLQEVLKPKGWNFFSGGEYMRKYAITHNLIDKTDAVHHQATIYGDHVDIEFDAMITKRLKEETHLVVESDLAGFNTRDIPHALRVLLVCEDKLRVDRIVNRDNMTVHEAIEHIKRREDENTEKWTRLYGDYNFWDPKYYNLIIDTYKNSPSETLEKVLEKLNL